MQRHTALALLALLLASPLAAQDADGHTGHTGQWALGSGASAPWRARISIPSRSSYPDPALAPSRAPIAPPLGTAGYLATLLDPKVEELGTLLARTPPRVSREHLDGAGAAELRYHGVPGGIVLGRVAQPDDSFRGARLCNDGGALHLRLADGRELRCPPFAPERLRACLDFVTSPARSDAVVDIAFARPRLAPAFAGTELGARLVELDGLPHRLLAETRAWKSLIVDRELLCEASADELRLDAELEVRFYVERDGLGVAERLLALVPSESDAARHPGAPSLHSELAPLREIAAWIGFLRWAMREDPAGVAALSAALHASGAAAR